MFKKLSKYGNSMALIIDKPILELLNIKEDTRLKITTDGKYIIIIPENKVPVVSDRKKVQEAFEEVVDEYSNALKKLADS